MGLSTIVGQPAASGVFAESFGASPSAAALVNKNAIQSALTAGGKVTLTTPGVYLISDMLLIGDNTKFELGSGVELRLVSSTGNVQNLIRTTAANNACNNAFAALTLAWTAGNVCTVSWTAHGRSKGDYVLLYGSGVSPSNFNGFFQITNVTDANTFDVRLWRTPSAGPTGTSGGIVGNKNITITGGLWNQQYPAVNGGAGSSYNPHGLMIGCCAHARVNNIAAINLYKYVVHTSATFDLNMENISGDNCSSDIVKIYGPCTNVSARHITGVTTDDIISVQAKEPAAYIQYMYAWGDVQNVEISHVSGFTITSIVGVFQSIGQYMGGIKISSVSGTGGYGVHISSGEVGCAIDNVIIDNVQTVAPTQVAMDSTGGACNLNHLVISNLKNVVKDYVTPTSCIGMDQYWTIGQLELISCDFIDTVLNAGNLIVTGNTIKNCLIQGGRFESQNNAGLWQNNGTIVNLTMVGFSARNVVKLLAYTQNVSQNVNVIGCEFDMYAPMLAVAGPTDLYIAGNNFITVTSGIIRTNAVVACNLSSGGGNRYNGQPTYTAPAAGTISVFGFDIPVDVGAAVISKTNPNQFCKNTSAGGARGTLVANRLVTCNGTNWIQVDTPANLF